MVRVYNILEMVISIKVNILMANHKAMDSIFGKIKVFIKGILNKG